MILAGFEAHYLDPLARTELTADGFATLADLMLAFADETTSGRVVSALEGGYSLKGISESVVAHVERLAKKGS
ncbi:MAG: histone deacetylase/AcuC/AphA family protein [Candidatus Poribacteria bacterium]|nr:histone deacetylase/AcuC/AphA family protein [Candidatus Poribacteria bacterium]